MPPTNTPSIADTAPPAVVTAVSNTATADLLPALSVPRPRVTVPVGYSRLRQHLERWGKGRHGHVPDELAGVPERHSSTPALIQGVMRVKKTLAGSVPCVWENSARNCPA